MVTIIAVEGNIGSGKSTTVDLLKKKYTNDTVLGNNVIFLQEPVKQWETITDNGEGILEKFYQDQEKWAFSFQMMAYISRLDILRTAVKENPNSVIFTERSLFTDKRVFAQMLHDDKKINSIDYQIYNKWFDCFIEEVPISGIVYLKTDPEVCNNRVQKRARKGESIPIEYLAKCSYYHDNWILNSDSPQLIIDGNVDTDSNPAIINTWLGEVDEFAKKLVWNKTSTINYTDMESYVDTLKAFS